MRYFTRALRSCAFSVVSSLSLLIGCQDSAGKISLGGDGRREFVSHVAGESTGPGAEGAGGAGGSSAPRANAGDSAGGDEAARAIAEADIIQMQGDRLFALSEFGGLTVVDVADPE